MSEPINYRKSTVYEPLKLATAASVIVTTVAAVALGMIVSDSSLLSAGYYTLVGTASIATLAGVLLTSYLAYKTYQNGHKPVEPENVPPVHQNPVPTNAELPVNQTPPQQEVPEEIDAAPAPAEEAAPGKIYASAEEEIAEIFGEEDLDQTALEQRYFQGVYQPRLADLKGMLVAVYCKAEGNTKEAVENAVDEFGESLWESAKTRISAERTALVALTKQIDAAFNPFVVGLCESFDGPGLVIIVPKNSRAGAIRERAPAKIEERNRQRLQPDGSLGPFATARVGTALRGFDALLIEFIVAFGERASLLKTPWSVPFKAQRSALKKGLANPRQAMRYLAEKMPLA